jgi:hypothetical protein
VGRAGGIVDHRPYCSGDCLGGGFGNSEADELLVDGQFVLGALLGQQLGRVDAQRPSQRKELMERDALLAGLHVGQGGAADPDAGGEPFLGHVALASQSAHSLAEGSIFRLDAWHGTIVARRDRCVNKADITACRLQRRCVRVVGIQAAFVS